MSGQTRSKTVFCGRPVTPGELGQIKETVALFSSLSQRELTHTICEHLDWRTPSGTNKWDACYKLLKTLEHRGLITLPPKRSRAAASPAPRQFSTRTAAGPPIKSDLKDLIKALGPVALVQAERPDQTGLWNEYTDRYHYLGYKKPFGYHIRYFIRAGGKNLGCLLFAGAARALACRDQWIGWSADLRRQNLHLIINNTRFLIFPWVSVKNLASHVLAMAGARVAGDWEKKWGFSPVLMETFVDPDLYKGTGYLAANWAHIGMTTGMGVKRKNKEYTTSPKKVFTAPLNKNFRSFLCNHAKPLRKPMES